MKDNVLAIGLALAVLLTFGGLGLAGWITPNYGTRAWTAKELAKHGRVGIECTKKRLIDTEHSFGKAECSCYCPPDASPGKISFPSENQLACWCPN